LTRPMLVRILPGRWLAFAGGDPLPGVVSGSKRGVMAYIADGRKRSWRRVRGAQSIRHAGMAGFNGWSDLNRAGFLLFVTHPPSISGGRPTVPIAERQQSRRSAFHLSWNEASQPLPPQCALAGFRVLNKHPGTPERPDDRRHPGHRSSIILDTDNVMGSRRPHAVPADSAPNPAAGVRGPGASGRYGRVDCSCCSSSPRYRLVAYKTRSDGRRAGA